MEVSGRHLAALIGAALLSATALAAPVEAFNLELRVAEREIRGRALRTLLMANCFELPRQAVQHSRNFAKLSNTLEPSLRELFNRLERLAVDARWTQVGPAWVASQRSAWTLDEAATRAQLAKASIEEQSSSAVAVTHGSLCQWRGED